MTIAMTLATTLAATLPDWSHESLARAAGFRCIAGVDEAGRGPLAGPVVAAAVVLDPDRIPPGLNDSKKLNASQRALACSVIMAQAHVGIGQASVAEIDTLNILRASHLAMLRALAALQVAADHALIDGNQMPREITIMATTLIGGDARCLSIAAASIVAKVTRDRVMVDLAQQHPGYGWAENAGYPTKRHKLALLELGLTPHHRRSFAPIHNLLWQAKL